MWRQIPQTKENEEDVVNDETQLQSIGCDR